MSVAQKVTTTTVTETSVLPENRMAYKQKELAEALGISVCTIKKLIWLGQGPRETVIGTGQKRQHTVILKADAEAWLAERRDLTKTSK